MNEKSKDYMGIKTIFGLSILASFFIVFVLILERNYELGIYYLLLNSILIIIGVILNRLNKSSLKQYIRTILFILFIASALFSLLLLTIEYIIIVGIITSFCLFLYHLRQEKSKINKKKAFGFLLVLFFLSIYYIESTNIFTNQVFPKQALLSNMNESDIEFSKRQIRGEDFSDKDIYLEDSILESGVFRGLRYVYIGTDYKYDLTEIQALEAVNLTINVSINEYMPNSQSTPFWETKVNLHLISLDSEFETLYDREPPRYGYRLLDFIEENSDLATEYHTNKTNNINNASIVLEYAKQGSYYLVIDFVIQPLKEYEQMYSVNYPFNAKFNLSIASTNFYEFEVSGYSIQYPSLDRGIDSDYIIMDKTDILFRKYDYEKTKGLSDSFREIPTYDATYEVDGVFRNLAVYHLRTDTNTALMNANMDRERAWIDLEFFAPHYIGNTETDFWNTTVKIYVVAYTSALKEYILEVKPTHYDLLTFIKDNWVLAEDKFYAEGFQHASIYAERTRQGEYLILVDFIINPIEENKILYEDQNNVEFSAEYDFRIDQGLNDLVNTDVKGMYVRIQFIEDIATSPYILDLLMSSKMVNLVLVFFVLYSIAVVVTLLQMNPFVLNAVFYLLLSLTAIGFFTTVGEALQNIPDWLTIIFSYETARTFWVVISSVMYAMVMFVVLKVMFAIGVFIGKGVVAFDAARTSAGM